jgi:hypothetical protein
VIPRHGGSVKSSGTAALAGVPEPPLEAGALAKDGLALHRLDDVGLDARLCERGPLSSLELQCDPVALADLLEPGRSVRVCAGEG